MAQPVLIGGWIVIGLVVAYLFAPDWPWIVLNGAVCATAWWVAARRDTTLLLQIVGGSLLGLYVLGIVLANQPQILPGLDPADPSLEHSMERMMREWMNTIQGGSSHTIQMSARMKPISLLVFVLHALIVLPLALCVPPLLNRAQRRKLGGPIWLSRRGAVVGLLAWVVLVVAVAWVSWPTVRYWIETPAHQPMKPPRGPMGPRGQQPFGPDNGDDGNDK
jgi:hypothetical protein